MIQLSDILRRCETGDATPEDAVDLSYLVIRLVRQVRAQTPDVDLCPACAGNTWGRRGGSEPDWSTRVCSTCGTVRLEPEEP